MLGDVIRMSKMELEELLQEMESMPKQDLQEAYEHGLELLRMYKESLEESSE